MIINKINMGMKNEIATIIEANIKKFRFFYNITIRFIFGKLFQILL